jgi:4-amino-4-deoxy-L-arabinose transferase-like glycosyltransferase
MPLFKTYFDFTQVTLLVFGASCFFISLIFFVNDKEKLSILFLILTALFINSFAALLDPYLNLWDERFHALVAKNHMNHPLMPTLFDNPVVNISYYTWTNSHIWLNKPPLFLWQIVLSYKLFGVSEFSLRIPDVILGTILVIIAYRSGKLLANKRVAYLAALLIISSNFLIELISGRKELDHNDFSFLVYISLSIWSFIEYIYTKRKIWIILIGIFSGMAILCKWLVGLLIYFGWFIYKVQEKKLKLLAFKNLSCSLFITLLIAIPWQILMFIKYPIEAKITYQLYFNHVTDALDGHNGTHWYYLEMFNNSYGNLALYFVIPSFIILYRKMTNKKLFFSLLSMVIIVYLFFSFSTTKMEAFTIVVAMIIFIAFASLIDFIFEKILSFKISKILAQSIFFIAISVFIMYRFNIELLQAEHTSWKKENNLYRMQINNKRIFTSLKFPSNTALFNIKRHYIEAMFYTGLPSYDFIPTKEQYYELLQKKEVLAIFKPDDGALPDYLINDPSVIIINEKLEDND